MRFAPSVLIAIFLLSIASCADDEPRVLSPAPDLAQLFPNADASKWSFDFEQRTIASPRMRALDGFDISNPAAMDPLDIERRVLQLFPLPTSSVSVRSGVLDLRLDGEMPTAAGPRQSLAASLVFNGKRAPIDISPLMARVLRGRPDLRAAMVANGLIPPEVHIAHCINAGPLFTQGAIAFEVGDDAIGYLSSCDNATGACVIACEPLTAKASFRTQLVPSIDPAIWQYGWVLGNRTVETAAGTFRDATALVYFYDFGSCLLPVKGGDDVVPFHSYGLSVLVCAPGIGPVYQRGIDVLAPCAPEFGMRGEIACHEATLRAYDLAP
ncbi:MAG: hypothetical protein ACKVU1_16165 [bacterium]